MGLAADMKLAAGFTWTSGFLTGSQSIVPGFRFTDGTSSGQANFVYYKAISLAAAAQLDIDLKGGTGEVDVLNVAMAATAVKAVVLSVTTPAAGTTLRVGPMGTANGATLWFQANTTNFWDEVKDFFVQADRVAGWALDATHKILSVKNPSAITVTGDLYVFGTK